MGEGQFLLEQLQPIKIKQFNISKGTCQILIILHGDREMWFTLRTAQPQVTVFTPPTKVFTRLLQSATVYELA